MTRTIFEWDRVKAEANLKKHAISFETATRVFADPFAVTVQDRIEGGEYRWQTFGLIDGHLVLLVAHTTWDEDLSGETVEVIRIVSARPATRSERQRYETEVR